MLITVKTFSKTQHKTCNLVKRLYDNTKKKAMWSVLKLVMTSSYLSPWRHCNRLKPWCNLHQECTACCLPGRRTSPSPWRFPGCSRTSTGNPSWPDIWIRPCRIRTSSSKSGCTLYKLWRHNAILEACYLEKFVIKVNLQLIKQQIAHSTLGSFQRVI